ncbi:MAG: DNA-directed DNA polymerase II small subunit [Euryarchaeota archaeon]|nr:DNA-directed DNA polymerase II small subunit [Euryarchaeota archaeon]
MEDLEILSKFLKSNINVHPLALQELKKNENIDAVIDRIISETQKAEKKPEVITLDFIESLHLTAEPTAVQAPQVFVERPRKRFLAEEYEAEIKFKNDITKKSFSNGNIQGFVEYFNDRYERLAKILRGRNRLRDAATIEWIRNTSFRGSVKIIGMVSEIRKSQKGHVILEVEDPTGAIPVLILNSNRELLEISREIVKDEVVGIEGNLGKSSDIVIASEIFFPDVPNNREQNKSEAPMVLAIISDTHVGSTKFLENEFLKFLKWLNGEIGSAKQVQLAERVKYLIVGGDLVDGVGIYPEQEGELLIKDIHVQYEKFAEFLSMVPGHIEIIVLPGNHDAVRQAEPQPAISEEFAGRLYNDARVHMVGNPCYATLHGVDVLSYHGRSLDDVISNMPGMSYSQPDKAMLTLIKKRHLTPIYGDKVPLAPEVYDYMLIDEVPDIFHFGHVHTVGVTNYRGVTLINSGTFQQQTSFQRKLNMLPTPAIVPVVDLQKQTTTKMIFR